MDSQYANTQKSEQCNDTQHNYSQYNGDMKIKHNKSWQNTTQHNNTWQNYIQYNDTHHINIQHNGFNCYTKPNIIVLLA